MGENRSRLHAELKAFVKVDAVQHATVHIRPGAFDERLVEPIVATVAQP